MIFIICSAGFIQISVWPSVVTLYDICWYSISTRFPYNKNEKSLHFPTQSASKVHTTTQSLSLFLL